MLTASTASTRLFLSAPRLCIHVSQACCQKAPGWKDLYGSEMLLVIALEAYDMLSMSKRTWKKFFCWHIHDPDVFITLICASLGYSRLPGYTDNAAPTSIPRYPQSTEPVDTECLLLMLFRMT